MGAGDEAGELRFRATPGLDLTGLDGAREEKPGHYVVSGHVDPQQDQPADYVLATGEGHTVQEFCDAAFSHVGLDWRDHVRFDENFMRPSEVAVMIGDASRAHRALGWKAETTALGLARLMVDADVEEINRFLGR